MANTARENILGKIRKSLSENAVPIPFPEVEKSGEVFAKENISLEEKFAKEFTALGGKFVYCSDIHEMEMQLQALADTMNWDVIQTKDKFILELFAEKKSELIQQATAMSDIQVGISSCEVLIARTGSIILSSAQEAGRSLPVYSPIHITIAYTKDIVWNIVDGIEKLNRKYNHKLPSMLCLTTGPSRTADIEKTLVVGVHGPKEVYLFLIEG